MMAKIGAPHKGRPGAWPGKAGEYLQENQANGPYLCPSFCRRQAFPHRQSASVMAVPMTGLAGPRRHRLPKPSLRSTTTGRIASSSPDN
jgi:hypothetical protein